PVDAFACRGAAARTAFLLAQVLENSRPQVTPLGRIDELCEANVNGADHGEDTGATTNVDRRRKSMSSQYRLLATPATTRVSEESPRSELRGLSLFSAPALSGSHVPTRSSAASQEKIVQRALFQ